MGEVDAALKPSNVAFQCVQALKERAKVIHQAPAFAPMERDSAGFERNPDASASQRPFGANVGLPFPFRGCREMEKDRKSTRLNSSHDQISYAVFCLKKKKKNVPFPYPQPYRILPCHAH